MSGFRLVKTQSGSGYTGKVFTYNVAAAHASLLATGDMVSETGTGTPKGKPQADATVAGALITGVITSIAPNFSNLEQAGLPAGIASDIKVEVDPEALYEVEISNGDLAVTNIGQNVDIVATAATLTGGMARSNMTIDAATAVAATAQCRIVGLVEPTDGTAIGAAGNLALVRINESFIKGVVGV
jgi:hypothetical protein